MNEYLYSMYIDKFTDIEKAMVLRLIDNNWTI